MGLSVPTARWLALAAFVFNFAAQSYGLLSSPNMKDVHYANLSFFSPQPLFIGLFFSIQQLFQLAWLWRLWRLNPSQSGIEAQELHQIVDFVPYYAVGNVCIGVWMFFWNASDLRTADIFVVVNTATQLFYVVSRLPRLDLNSTSSILTHIVSKTFAGIGVLDLLHNTSVAYFKDETASTLVRVLTGVGCALAAASSDWILGLCLVYDLVAMSAGQGPLDGGWAVLLGAYALGTAGIVAIKNLAFPPYERKVVEYAEAAQDET